MLTIDCRLGALRDWDLLSFATAPALFWAAQSLCFTFKENIIAGSKVVIVILLFALLWTGPWVVVNHTKDDSYEAFKPIIAADIHYAANYDRGVVNFDWARLVLDLYQDGDEGVAAQERRLAGAPDDVANRHNLAMNLYQMGRIRRAYEVLDEQWRDFQMTPRIVGHIIAVLSAAGDTTQLVEVLETAIAANEANAVFTDELKALKRIK